MGSTAEVRITAASRWSVRGELLRILHSPSAEPGSIISCGSSSSVSGVTSSGTSGGGGSSSAATAGLAQPWEAGDTAARRHENTAADRGTAHEAAAAGAQAVPGCGTCGSGAACCMEAPAQSCSSGGRCGSSDCAGRTDAAQQRQGDDAEPASDGDTATAAAAASAAAVAVARGDDNGAETGVAVATAQAEAKAAPAAMLSQTGPSGSSALLQEVQLVDVLLCAGAVLGLCGVLATGVLTLVQT